jgi:hypothetical protein
MSYNAKSLNSGKRTPFTQDGSLLDCEATPAASAVHDLQGCSSAGERRPHTTDVAGSIPATPTNHQGAPDLALLTEYALLRIKKLKEKFGSKPQIDREAIPAAPPEPPRWEPRFDFMVKRYDHPKGCWEWQAAKSSFGHGRAKIGGKLYSPHRLAYEKRFGPIPAGKMVLHKCDNPSCVNPDHLFIGTARDNVRDMMSKGRAHWMKRPKSEPL